MKFQLSLDLPVLARPASLQADAVFFYGGRPLRVHRVLGTDAAAPVIVEELSGAVTLPGQYGLWSNDAVSKAFANTPFAPARRPADENSD